MGKELTYYTNYPGMVFTIRMPVCLFVCDGGGLMEGGGFRDVAKSL